MKKESRDWVVLVSWLVSAVLFGVWQESAVAAWWYFFAVIVLESCVRN